MEIATFFSFGTMVIIFSFIFFLLSLGRKTNFNFLLMRLILSLVFILVSLSNIYFSNFLPDWVSANFWSILQYNKMVIGVILLNYLSTQVVFIFQENFHSYKLRLLSLHLLVIELVILFPNNMLFFISIISFLTLITDGKLFQSDLVKSLIVLFLLDQFLADTNVFTSMNLSQTNLLIVEILRKLILFIIVFYHLINFSRNNKNDYYLFYVFINLMLMLFWFQEYSLLNHYFTYGPTTQFCLLLMFLSFCLAYKSRSFLLFYGLSLLLIEKFALSFFIAYFFLSFFINYNFFKYIKILINKIPVLKNTAGKLIYSNLRDIFSEINCHLFQIILFLVLIIIILLPYLNNQSFIVLVPILLFILNSRNSFEFSK